MLINAKRIGKTIDIDNIFMFDIQKDLPNEEIVQLKFPHKRI